MNQIIPKPLPKPFQKAPRKTAAIVLAGTRGPKGDPGSGGGGGGAVSSVAGRTGDVVLNKSDVGLGNVDNTSDAAKPVSAAQQTALNAKQNSLGFTPENAANKGAVGGYAGLDGSGKVPSAQLPAFVDDVLEYANLAAFPVTGTAGLIYVALDTNKTYRWSGSAYVEISPSPGSTDSVTEGATNKYFTESRVLATVLTGLSLASNAAITSADSVLSALGKLQKQASDAASALAGNVRGTVLTGLSFTSTALVTAADTILQAVGKLQAQLMTVVDDGGAVGDGVTDDTAALQSVWTAGRTLRLSPRKTYLFSSSLVPSVAGTGIEGNGATLVMKASGFNNADGHVSYRYGTNAVGIYANGKAGAFVRNTKIKYETYTDGLFVKAIAMTGCAGAEVSGCEIWNFSMGLGQITMNDSPGFSVFGNYIHDITSNRTANVLVNGVSTAMSGVLLQMTGIEVDQDAATGSTDFAITGNRIENITVGAAALAALGYQSDGINIAGRALSLRGRVSGNRITMVGEGIDNFGDHMVIEGNIIRNAYNYGVKLIHGASNCQVVHNVIVNPGLEGVEIAGSTSANQDTADNLVAHNKITGIDSAGNWSASGTSGVRLNANGGTTYLPRRNTIAGNLIDGGGTGKNGVLGTSGNGTLNAVLDNRISNTTSREMNLDATVCPYVRAFINGGAGGTTSYATNANITLTSADGPNIIHSGTLTANRTVTLPSQNVYEGMSFDFVRTGSGAFTLDIGTGPLVSLSQNGTARVRYVSGAWALVAFGSLVAPSGSGDMVLAATQTVTGAKTFNDGTLLLNNTAGTFTGKFQNANTAARTYTLKDASGTLAFTSDIPSSLAGLTGGAWKVLYTNGSGVFTEVALGSSGQVLTSNGPTSAPSMQTPSGSGDMLLGTAQTNTALKTFNDGTIGLRNVANSFTGLFSNTITAARTWTLPDKSGTVAMTSDITGTNSGTNTGDQTITLTGDVTGSGTGSFAATIAAGAVSLAKMANMATASLIYRKTGGSGAPEVNTLATLKTDLGLSGTNSGDQTSLSGITGGAWKVVYTNGSGVFTEVALGSSGQVLTSNGPTAAPTMQTPAGGGGSPGGSSGQIQYNNGGAFGGLSDSSVAGRVTKSITLGTALSANADDWNPSSDGYVAADVTHQILQVTSSKSVGIKGINGCQTAGKLTTIVNANTDYLVWLEHGTSTTSGYRFALPDGFPAFLMPGDSITLLGTGSSAVVWSWPARGQAMGLTIFDDFSSARGAAAAINPAGGGLWGTSANGGSGYLFGRVNSLVDTTEKAVGVVLLRLASSTYTDIGFFSDGSANETIVPGQGCALSVARIARVTAPNSSLNYTFRSGFFNWIRPTDGGNGIGWELRFNGTAEEWAHLRYAAGTATRSATGSPTPDGTFMWAITFMNAAWSRADFIYSTDSKNFTLAESVTTGLPSSSQLVGWQPASCGVAGGTAANRDFYCDFAGYRDIQSARG